MDNDRLIHYGVKGMRWGVIRSKEELGRGSIRSLFKKKGASTEDFDSEKKKTDDSEPKKKKKVKEMTDAELREQINRLSLEKQYVALVRELNPQKKNRGREFAIDVLEKSGKNIATQLTTYVLGKSVNKAFADIFDDPEIINPKKGQKDK